MGFYYFWRYTFAYMCQSIHMYVLVYIRMLLFLLLLLMDIILICHFAEFTHFFFVFLFRCLRCVYIYFCAKLFALSTSNALMLIKVDIFFKSICPMSGMICFNKFQVIILGERTNVNILILYIWKDLSEMRSFDIIPF